MSETDVSQQLCVWRNSDLGVVLRTSTKRKKTFTVEELIAEVRRFAKIREKERAFEKLQEEMALRKLQQEVEDTKKLLRRWRKQRKENRVQEKELGSLLKSIKQKAKKRE